MTYDDVDPTGAPRSTEREDRDALPARRDAIDTGGPRGLCGTPGATGRSLPRGEQLGALLESLEPRMTAIAMRITRNHEAARDVVQNACEKIVRHGHSFRGQSLVSTWVHRIVANEALMWLRGERRRREVQPAFDDPAIADDAPGAAEQLLTRELRGRVRAGLARLSPKERDVLEHCGLSESSYAQYGARTGAHIAAIKSRAFRARRRLGEVLAER